MNCEKHTTMPGKVILHSTQGAEKIKADVPRVVLMQAVILYIVTFYNVFI